MTKVTKFIREVMTELHRASWPWDPKERGAKKYREISLWDTILLYFSKFLNYIV